MSEFDEEERLRVHAFIDKIVGGLDDGVTEIPVTYLPTKESCDIVRDAADRAIAKGGGHQWVTIVRDMPLQRRCSQCKCLLTVFKSGVATYQMPGDDVTTRRPECK